MDRCASIGSTFKIGNIYASDIQRIETYIKYYIKQHVGSSDWKYFIARWVYYY